MADDKIKCPHCGSEQIHSDKKGFSTGKAVAGTLVGGVLIGAAVGAAGQNKIKLTCLKCGKQFNIGDKPISYLEKKRKEERENKSGKIFFIVTLVLFIIFLIWWF